MIYIHYLLSNDFHVPKYLFDGPLKEQEMPSVLALCLSQQGNWYRLPVYSEVCG